MTTLTNFFLANEDVHIDDDVRMIGETRIVGGSLIVTGNITLDHDNKTHANIIITDGDLTASAISLPAFRCCDTIYVEGSICVEDGIYLDGCNVTAYNIYTKYLYTEEVTVLFDILFTTGSVKELKCNRDCYIEVECDFKGGGLTVDGKFEGYAYNIGEISIGRGIESK